MSGVLAALRLAPKPSPIGRELCDAYERFVERALPRRTRDIAVEAQLLRHRPNFDQAAHAWTVAGDFYGGRRRRDFAVYLLLQWALRGLEVGA